MEWWMWVVGWLLLQPVLVSLWSVFTAGNRSIEDELEMVEASEETTWTPQPTSGRRTAAAASL